MSSTPTLLQSVAILAAVPVGMVLHELCHYVIAWLARLSPRFEAAVTSSMAVAYDTPARDWVDAAVRLAPVWLGGAAAIGAIGRYGWPALSWWWVAGCLCWAFATIRESGDDIRDVFGEPADWEADLLRGSAAMLAATLLMLSPYNSIGAVLIGVALPTYTAGIALMILGSRSRPGYNLEDERFVSQRRHKRQQ